MAEPTKPTDDQSASPKGGQTVSPEGGQSTSPVGEPPENKYSLPSFSKSNKHTPEVEPVWKRPGWITAMVALVSIFLTVPDIVSKYVTSTEKVETIKQQNIALKLDQQFKIVNTALKQKGTERVFLLRYLAATLDNPEKSWAKEEVERLDDVASLRNKSSETERLLEKKQKELDSLLEIGKSNADALADRGKIQLELEKLQSDLAQKNNELSELRQKAGIDQNDLKSTIFIAMFSLNWDFNNEEESLKFRVHYGIGAKDLICEFGVEQCELIWNSGNNPQMIFPLSDIVRSSKIIAIKNSHLPGSISITEMQTSCHLDYSKSGTLQRCRFL